MDVHPPCVIPRSLCGCNWRMVPDPFALVTRYQHGENPEHSREFTKREAFESEMCAAGHAVIVEEWIAQTMAYAHPS